MTDSSRVADASVLAAFWQSCRDRLRAAPEMYGAAHLADDADLPGAAGLADSADPRDLPDVPDLPEAVPEAWAFGATPAHADELLELVLAGVKTGTATSLWDLEATDEPMPAEGEFSIILDGAGAPRAVIETTSVRIVPFDEVDAEHARAEGEGDRTLAQWREIHERYWRKYSENPRGYAPDMPVVCERFRVVYS